MHATVTGELTTAGRHLVAAFVLADRLAGEDLLSSWGFVAADADLAASVLRRHLPALTWEVPHDTPKGDVLHHLQSAATLIGGLDLAGVLPIEEIVLLRG